MTKQEARKEMGKRRRQLSCKEREQKSQSILKNLMQMDAMQSQKYFFPFVSYGTEVDTIPIIETVLQEGRMEVAVPRVQADADGEMDFYRITSLSELSKGYQGILEPDTQACIFATEGVMLLPGLAFDQRKNRVGYGGGYYDRYLKRCQSKQLVTVALAFDFQIVEQIEAERFDIRPQWIVTDQGIF